MQKCLVALGSNVTFSTLTPSELVEKAFELIESESVRILCRSRFFQTPAFPVGAGPDFVNAAGSLETDLSAERLMKHLHEVEAQLGRTRSVRWEPRACDIDLLSYGDAVLPDPRSYQRWVDLPLEQQMTQAPEQLILPHPRLAERGFVLVPLKDVAPDWVHPVTGKTVDEMLDALPPDAVSDVIPLPG